MGVIEDKKGSIWISTRNGLNRMLNRSLENQKSSTSKSNQILFKNYMFGDGFLGVNAYTGSIFQDSRNQIWIGTGDRLICYHPEGEVPDTISPNIQLSSIALFNENVNWIDLALNNDTSFTLGNGVNVSDFKFNGLSKWYSVPQNLSLAYNNNYLTFKYIGIATRSPYKIRYQYKLDGLEDNWNAITDRNEAPYGNIPNGTYTFKVKAMNSEGYWSNEIHYTFTIRAPWWKTWWFRILAAAAVAASVYGVYRYRLNQILRVQSIRNKIAHDLHDDIGSTLNSISIYSEIAKQQTVQQLNALEMIGESSRKVIDSMSDIVWAINSDNDSFEKIILRMRSLSYNLLHAKNIQHIFKVDESLNDQKLSIEDRRNFYLIFKEALNNLVKYSAATKAEIYLEKNHTNVALSIKDNGKGFDVNNEYNGNGLISMKQRAKEMNATIEITSSLNEGTKIELKFKTS